MFWANEDETYLTAMKRALEAAAPHMLAADKAEAWDEGYGTGRAPRHQRITSPNPYRGQA